MKGKAGLSRWAVVVLAFLLYLVNMASWLWIFGLFFTPFSETFGWQRSTASLGIAVYFVLSAALSPVVGRLGDRYGYVRLMFFSVILVGLAHLGLSRVQNLGTLYVFYGLLGIGNTAGGVVVVSAVVARSYAARRGLFLGIAALGLSLGGFAIAPFTQLFIEQWDFRMAFLALGALTWAVGIPAVLLLGYVTRKPRVAASDAPGPPASPTPDSHGHAVSRLEAPPRERSTSGWQALRSRVLWLLLGTVFFQAAGEMGTVAHEFEMLKEGSIGASLAALFVGVTAGVTALGRLVTGVLGDRYSAQRALFATYAFQGLGVAALLAVILTGNVLWVAPFLLLYGMGIGGCVVGRGLVIAQSFGLASFGLLMGLLDMAHQAGAAIGIWVPAYLYDLQGTYQWGLVFFLGCYLLSLLLLGLVQPVRPAGRRVSLPAPAAGAH